MKCNYRTVEIHLLIFSKGGINRSMHNLYIIQDLIPNFQNRLIIDTSITTLSRLKYFNSIKITHYNCGIIWPSEQWGAWMGIEVY